MAPLRTALKAIPSEHFTEPEGALEAELAREGVLAAAVSTRPCRIHRPESR